MRATGLTVQAVGAERSRLLPQPQASLTMLLFMSHLSQAFFALVGRHFMAFALFAAGHSALRYLF